MSWRQWLALFFVFLVYLLFGGVVFMLIESPEEQSRIQQLKQLQLLIYDELVTCNDNQTTSELEERTKIWEFIAEQLGLPALVRDEKNPAEKWTLFNSFFVALTAASTIGYGHLAPSSTSGRLFCIAFSLFGIPLNGMLFATLGDYFGNKLMGLRPGKNERPKSNFARVLLLLADTVFYLIPGSVIFLAIPAVLFSYAESWSYIDSFYYAFISLTTIGFGDLVAGQNDIGPWTWTYRFVIVTWIFVGLGYLVMVINVITKGMRSTPVVALEKKMAARIHATRRALAQDARLLRQLVNQIRVMKVKPIYKTEKPDIRRTGSYPSVFYDDPCDEKKSTDVADHRTGMKCITSNSDTALTSIDVQATFQNGTLQHAANQETDTQLHDDPIELLARLANVLCTEEIMNDGNMSSASSDDAVSCSDDVHDKSLDSRSSSQRSKKLYFLARRASQRSRKSTRSLNYPTIKESPSFSLEPPADSAAELELAQPSVSLVQELAVRVPKANRLTRSTSESQQGADPHLYGDSKVLTEMSTRKTRAYLRSVSDSQQPSSLTPVAYSPSHSQHPTNFFDLSASKLAEDEASASEAAQRKISLSQFCDILDRVQISRQNSTTQP